MQKERNTSAVYDYARAKVVLLPLLILSALLSLIYVVDARRPLVRGARTNEGVAVCLVNHPDMKPYNWRYDDSVAC